MKHKFTFTSLILLFALFAIGQKAQVKNQPKLFELETEKHWKNFSKLDWKNNYEWAFSKRFYSQRKLLKSSQTILQRLDSLVFQSWDKNTNQWNYSGKHEYIYDDDGNMAQFIIYILDNSKSKWIGYEKYEYSYDAKGNWMENRRYSYNKSTEQWSYQGGLKTEYSYDEFENIVQSLLYERPVSENKWYEAQKDEYIYDANGNMIQRLAGTWTSASPWVANYKDEYTFDPNGNLIRKIEYEWDSTQWIPDIKKEFTNDENGNKTEATTYYWEESASKWETQFKEEYTYDLSYDLTDLLLPLFYDVLREVDVNNRTTNKPLELSIFNWDETSNDWVDDGKGIYYYSEQNVSTVNNFANEIVKIFPNPVSDCVSFTQTINLKPITFELYDIQGRKLLNTEINTNEKISLKNINSGIYFYNLYIDGNRQCGKLIKE